jgi:tripartite-type tricarboxylate transporter receptor subunit TctC
MAQPSRSEGWPQRPVKIIVPFAPGGNTDGLARIMAQRLGEALGHAFVVENRPSGGGSVAAEAVARSPADGYTLFMASVAQIAIVPAMMKATYDPVKDFAPISVIGTNPYILVVNPSLPVQSLREFVDYVKARPNMLSHAIAGPGGVGHLAMALFTKRTGIDLIPVMYRGGGVAPQADVIAGHVPIFMTNLSVAVPYAASGQVRPLAVLSEKRVPQLPNVPTFTEAGFPGLKIIAWNGLMAPAGTPKEIIDVIAKEIALAVKEPKLVELLTNFGVEPLGNTPEEFAAMIAADIPLWAEAVKIAGVEEK